MKISYLSTADIPSRKANSVHIMKMCAAFAQNGHAVTLYAPKLKNTQDEDLNVFEYYGVEKSFRISRVNYPAIFFGHYFYAFFVFIKVSLSKTDLIYSRNLLSMVFTSILRTDKILEIHQPIPDTSRLQDRLFRFLIGLNSFKQLVVITKPLKSIFISKYSIPEKMILVAADGADIPSHRKEESSQELNRIQVGYVGHLYKGRGIELIMDIASMCPWADFFIVGGNTKDIERVRILSTSINNMNIVGFVSPAKADELRGRMDVLLAPYQTKVGLENSTLTTEAWMSPLKIFEYMASCKAIISSDIPVLHEVLQHNKNCMLCSPSNLVEWKEALEALREDKNLRIRLANKAFRDLTTKYTWKIRANNIVKLIRL